MNELDALTEKYGYHPDRSFESLGNVVLEERLSPEKIITTEVPKELAALLTNSPISDPDKEYVKAILQRTPEVASDVESLLRASTTTTQARRKIQERNSQTHTDLGSLLAPFSYKERVILAQNMGAIQLTDGCTVGCAWCGVQALRRTTTAFSLPSLVKFAHEYGESAKHAILYYASDPFDWVDGKYTYLDIHPVWEIYSQATPFVSTAVPVGSEFSILRFIEAQYNLITVYNEIEKDNTSLTIDCFRFSRTNRNAARVDQMLNILSLRCSNEDLIRRMIVIADHSDDEIFHIGYFINHPGKDELYDNPGITCQDSVVISPVGITARTMEVYTRKSPKGMREWTITPGEMQVPVYQARGDYYASDFSESRTVGLAPFSILPYPRILHVKNGDITDLEEVRSIGRDALAFCFTAGNMDYLRVRLSSDAEDHWLNNFPGGLRAIERHLADFEKRFAARKESATPLSNNPDEASVRIAQEYARMTWERLEAVKEVITTLKRRRKIFFGLPTPFSYY